MSMEQELKQKQIGLFDIVSNITSSKEKLFEDELAAYEPFMINRALSQNMDTILLACEMDKTGSSLDKKMQYDFYFNVLPKKKRYGKWNKSTEDVELIKQIQEVYGYSITRVKEVLPFFVNNREWLNEKTNKGGRVKTRKITGKE